MLQRTHYCGELAEKHIDTRVVLCGWVHSRRDHGGVIFVDLRDREGLVQVVFNPENVQMFQLAESLRSEYVIAIQGLVRIRPQGTTNPNLKTGQIEVVAQQLTILNRSEPLPFILDEYHEISEEVRLRYRYLDLRREEMQWRLRLRAQTAHLIRQYLNEHGFLEIETPMLTRATPEGARDYLVPSRVHQGSFYALPQSPQLFKQLLMMAGFDRYFQIVRCFRDEDLRADRQPEFTQLDAETTFLDEATIQSIFETMVRKVFAELLHVTLPDPFPRLTYAEAMYRYGSDKPDLRIPLELVDVTDLVKQVEFKVFAAAANAANSRVAALCLPNGVELSRKELDDYTQYVSIFGAKGLAYIRILDRQKGLAGLQSPILKFLPESVTNAILDRVNAKNGDVIFFGADKTKIVHDALGALRVKLGYDRKLLQGEWRPLWVVDFPMFEWDENQQRWQALHHPFTAPRISDIEHLHKNPSQCLSRAYDMVLNGTEVGGGSIRIHDIELQLAVFELLGIDLAAANEKFGFLLQGLKYGCPPMGGIAFGFDRLIMLMAGANSIREVMAFPKTQTASCLLTNAPSVVSEAQLRELGIRLRKRES